MSNKFCEKCYTENQQDANVCIFCGKAFTNYDTTPDTQPLTGGRKKHCPAGKHPMDDGWEVCPYCQIESQQTNSLAPVAQPLPVPAPPQGRRKTVFESTGPHRPPTVQEPPLRPVRPPTTPEAPLALPPRSAELPSPSRPSPPSLRKTLFDKSSASGPASQPNAFSAGAVAPPTTPINLPVPPTNLRRMVALLVTSTWRAEGQVFPIREGRNRVGRDEDCDVVVPDDNQMSGRHALILHRGDRFTLKDDNSLCGTLLEGQYVPEDGWPLANYSQIRMGATEWVFIVIDPFQNPDPV